MAHWNIIRKIKYFLDSNSKDKQSIFFLEQNLNSVAEKCFDTCTIGPKREKTQRQTTSCQIVIQDSLELGMEISVPDPAFSASTICFRM